jgi:protein AroM
MAPQAGKPDRVPANPPQVRLGVLLIGQTPRADLLAPLDRLRGGCELAVRGALDGVRYADIPTEPEGSYPLVTRLRDGARVTVDERFLTPLLQAAIDELELDGAMAVLLLCAGPFRDLTGSRPLIRPFQLAARVLGSLGLRRVGVVVPTDDQRAPALEKWANAGVEPIVLSVEAKPVNESLAEWLVERSGDLPDVSALVLDYVGYPIELLRHLQSNLRVPVVDLGHLAVAVAEALVTARSPISVTGGGGA